MEKILEVDKSEYLPDQKWISVKERLPEIHKEVLIYTGKGGDVIQAYRGHTFWRGSLDVTDNMRDGYVHDRDICPVGTPQDVVTHWMPLPEPPQESEL